MRYSCRFVELIVSVSNLNRQPALVDGCRFVELVCFESATESATGNSVAGCQFVEPILPVSNLNRQPAISCRWPIR